jgi:hypothetical protein
MPFQLDRDAWHLTSRISQRPAHPDPQLRTIPQSGRREVRALELFAILEALGVSMSTFWRRWQTESLE